MRANVFLVPFKQRQKNGRKENMNRKTISGFVGRRVKLVTEGYALYGTITELGEDCILFESKEAISAISLNAIDKIVCQYH